MHVSEWMSLTPITVARETTVAAARNIMREKEIRHLPVCDTGRLVGIVSERDILRALPSPLTGLSPGEIRYVLDSVTVDGLMTRPVITIAPGATVADAVGLLLANRIGALPVTASDRLLGIITETDLLSAFASRMGEAAELRDRPRSPAGR
jgi:acetoin utilization protein AcuB